MTTYCLYFVFELLLVPGAIRSTAKLDRAGVHAPIKSHPDASFYCYGLCFAAGTSQATLVIPRRSAANANGARLKVKSRVGLTLGGGSGLLALAQSDTVS